MTYQTKLWHFYWGRLGYENINLPTKCKDALGGSSGDPPTEYGKVSRAEQTSRPTTESPRDQNPLD
jgi:hypothetical protein